MQLLINIRGTNGSGKSTIPLAMRQQDPDMYELIDKANRTEMTIFPNFGFIAVGLYRTATGGMDRLHGNEEYILNIHEALSEASKYGYDVLMEGIMASTVRSFYGDLFRDIGESEYNGVTFKPIVMFFTTPPEVCIPRIYARNGGKPILECKVHSKYKSVMNQFDFFKEKGVKTVRVNTANTPIENMLPNFLKSIEKYRIQEVT